MAFQVLFPYHLYLPFSVDNLRLALSIAMVENRDSTSQPSPTLNTGVTMNKSDEMTEPLPEGPTDSHALSQIEPEEKGLTQQTGDSSDVTDLGWSSPADCIEEPLIAGLLNEDLWMLIRRFDKVSPHA